MDDDFPSPAAALAASSATQRKWASCVLLGPLLPSLFAIVIVVVGGAIVNIQAIDKDADRSCGYPIDMFVKWAIGNSYLLLAVFTWSFLGFETQFSIRGRKRRLLRPFSSLSFVAVLYLLLFVMSLVVWIVGTWAVAKDLDGRTCSDTMPLLYKCSVTMVTIYWIGVFFGIVGLVGSVFGKKLKSGAQISLAKTKTYAEDRDKRELLEAERQLVGRKFDALDEEGAGTIEIEQVEALINDLGLGLSSKKLKKAMTQLDPEGEGVVWKDEFLNWYVENGERS